MALEMSLVEGGIARLQSPAGLGLGIGGAPRELFSLWRVGALLLLAALATYGNLIARVRLLLRRFHSRLRKSDVLPQPPQRYCSSDDDDTWSSVSDDEEEELLSAPEDEPEEEEEEENGQLMMRQGFLGDYEDGGRQSGGFNLRGGREVVKTWGREDLRFRGPSSALGCVISLCHLHGGEVVRSFTAGPVASTQPSVMLSATGTDFGRRLELHAWDSGVAGRAPLALAGLSPRLRRRVQHLGGGGMVAYAYVGDGAGSAAAVDLRTVRSPIHGVAEEEAAWWDADAVLWAAATSPISS